MAKYSHILQPLRLGKNVLLKSRLISTDSLPHFLQGPETWPTDAVILYQASLAKNGAAIVTMGEWTNPTQHQGFGDGAHFPSWDATDPSVENSFAQYCDAIHFYGSKALISLFPKAPRGYAVNDGDMGGMPPMGMPQGDPNDDDVAPFDPFGGMPGGPGGPGGPEKEDKDGKPGKPMMGGPGGMGGPQKALTTELMEKITADLVEQCRYYQGCGFDGISVHMAYQAQLLANFLSPMTNHRTDAYGGSLENRARFPLMVFRGVREAMGSEFIIEARMSGLEAEGGITIEDTIAFARLAEGAVDILQIRAGDGDAAHPTTFNSTRIPVTLAVAEAVKQSGAKVIVAPVGGYQNPDDMEAWLAEGKCDMIAAARAFICDPEYGKKLLEGRGEDVIPCIRCNKCHGASRSGPWLSFCSVNPELGLGDKKDRLMAPPDRVKQVAVLGGGPAGMNAARICALRGHRVTLFERQAVLGGQLIHADYAAFKWTIRDFKDYLVRQVHKLGVEVRLNTCPTPEQLQQEGFDTLIVANGTEPNIPDIPGLLGPDGKLNTGVWTPISVFGHEEELGHRVVVVGGSEIGCETGMYLAQAGHDVTVITRQNRLAPSADRVHYALPALGYYGLKQKTGCTTLCYRPGQVTYRNHKGAEKTLDCDALVISGGLNPRQEAALAYYGCCDEFYVVGDSAGDGEGTIARAMRTSWAAASQV